MCASRILPIATPDITAYTHFTFALSVMYTDEDAMRWVYSNYIQICLRDWGPTSDMDYYTQTAEEHLIPCFQGSQRFTRDTILHYSPSFIDFARHAIDNNFYVWTYVDEFFIPGAVAYQNTSNPHSVMFSGYDDEKRQFLMSGYFSNQSYSTAWFDYDLIDEAFKGFETSDFLYTNFTRLLRLNQETKSCYDFNLPWIIEQLRDFVDCEQSDYTRMPMSAFRRTSPYYWGMDVYDQLQNLLQRHINGETIVDHRPFHIIWEHKKMMSKRLSYMAEHGHFTFSPSIVEGYKELEQFTLVTRNMMLKYLLSFNNMYLEQMIGRMGQLREKETPLVRAMLEEYEQAAKQERQAVQSHN